MPGREKSFFPLLIVTPTKPQFQILLFDMDGTLIDSRQDLASAVNYALRAVNKSELPLEEIVQYVGDGLKQLLMKAMKSENDGLLTRATKAFNNYYRDHCVDETVLYDGVKEAIEDLSSAAHIAVVTNKPKNFADIIVKKLDLNEHIHLVIGGDSCEEKKPHPAPLLNAIKILGGVADSALMIGDGLQDIDAGRNAGVKTCVARYGYGFRPDVMDRGPTYVIDQFQQLKEIVL